MNRVSGFQAGIRNLKETGGLSKRKKQDRFHPKVRLILQYPFLNLQGVYIFIFLYP